MSETRTIGDNMSKFKDGDRVRRTKGSDHREMILDREYTVARSRNVGTEEEIQVTVMPTFWWDASYFIQVQVASNITQFKDGDTVKLLTDGGYRGDCKAGDIGTVTSTVSGG